MTSFDFSPLFRSTVGFDRMMRLLENSSRVAEAGQGYPPYNIEKTGEDAYRITLAVAGFGEDEISIEVREGTLTIEGARKDEDTGASYLYRGIAGRGFKRQFQLADHVEVEGAKLFNGLLTLDLQRRVPEALKPRRIEVSTAAPAQGAADAPKQVSESKRAA